MVGVGDPALAIEVSKESVLKSIGPAGASGTTGSLGDESATGALAVAALSSKSTGTRTSGPAGNVAAGSCAGAGAPGEVTIAGVGATVEETGAFAGARTVGEAGVFTGARTVGEAGEFTGARTVGPGGEFAGALSTDAGSLGGETAGAVGLVGGVAASSSAGAEATAGWGGITGSVSFAALAGAGPTARTVRGSGSGAIGAAGDVVTTGGGVGTRLDVAGRSARLEAARGSRENCWLPTPISSVVSATTTVPAIVGVSNGVGRNFGPIADMAANRTAIMNRPNARITRRAALAETPTTNTRNARQQTTLAKRTMEMIKASIKPFRRHCNQKKARFMTRILPRRGQALPCL